MNKSRHQSKTKSLMNRLILFLLLSCQSLFAQTNLIKDSLLNVLATAKDDSNKVLLLYRIGQETENNNPEEAKAYYRQAKRISERLNYTMGLLKYYSNYTAALRLQARFDSSLTLNKEALRLATDHGNEERIAVVHQNISADYSYLHDIDNAINHLLMALPYYEKDKNDPRLSVLYNQLGTIFNDARMYDKAQLYLRKALNISRVNEDFNGETIALLNLGYLYKKLNRLDSALMFVQESMSIARKDNNDVMLGQSLNYAAAILLAQSKFDSSFKYTKEALVYSEKFADSLSIANNLHPMAIYYFNKKEFKKSEELALKGSGIANANGYTMTQQIYNELLAKLALVKGDLIKYNEYDRLAIELSEKLFNERLQENVLVQDKKYETAKKEAQILLQQADIKQKKTLNYFLGAGIAASLLILLFAYRNYKHRRKLQEQKIADLEKEKLLLATQSLLKGQEEERSRLAKDLHDGLGGLLSGVKLQLGAMKGNLILSEENGRTFNNALGKLDESISEMRRVAHNMMPEALLKLGLQQALQDYCDGLSESQPFKINCEFHALEKRMPPSTEIVVYRIVQELLNNAVKHSGATTILAQVIRQGDSLSITVEDNGKGFDENESDFTKGTGLKNIHSRVDYLKGKLDIKSAPGKGTSIHIDCIINGNG
jgi:two-component system, NarL family, sensor kinase